MENKINAGSSKVFNDDDIHWVITVPAIWDLRSKEFMRKAAEKVRFNKYIMSFLCNRLLLVFTILNIIMVVLIDLRLMN